ncbi:ubiquitin carboxyl-terminal hydrolase 34 [Alternaria panax]|uniref:Ubiquitin carboxyl-terminal hydrolase 34 n=1 Tax=Alternaria panax TaxID=48097 RepID=A0AAD4I9P3_9PLEO|nr:ubiquitin carboxyl-terminal hydrolase 34 [Alternaria panax]
MTAPDIDIVQSVAADEPAITASASSPPRRDPIEDADASYTRKRPRLHSGSNSLCAMPSEPQTPANTSASPSEQQVEMTIRSHPPSSPIRGGDEDHGDANDFLEDPSPTPGQSPIIITSSEDERGSPPIMIIDDDDDEAVGFSMQLDAEDYFRQFPYSQHGSYSTVVRDLTQHIQGIDNDIDFEFFPGLSQWLADLPEPSANLHGFYTSKAMFWDDFSVLVNKVLSRRAAFGHHLDDRRTNDNFCGFLSAYIRTCSFLLLADVHLLSRSRPNEMYNLPLLSQKHMRNWHTILLPDKAPVFSMVSKEYSADIRKMVSLLQKDFLAANGAQNLLRLANEAFHHVPSNTQAQIAAAAAPILVSLGVSMFQDPKPASAGDRSEFCRGILLFLKKYMEDLFDLSRTTDSTMARDQIQHFYTLLFELCLWDRKIESDLVDRFLDFRSADSSTTSSSIESSPVRDQDEYRNDPQCFPMLVANAWKFKILRRYLTKGKMDLRVMSIGVMDISLVEIWKQYNEVDPTGKHPVMRYLADFLLEGKVVDYLVSVDSHPQLIARSGNIVGFLIVTQRWTDSQADAIWNTIATNPDPRVVTATMSMLRPITHLMKPADHLYFCTKLYEMPISSYTMEIFRFLQDLGLKIVDKASPEDYATRESTARPWNVCIRLVRDIISQKAADKDMLDLYCEAAEHLKTFAHSVSVEERHSIYRDCADHIGSNSSKATGSVRVIFSLASPIPSGDGPFFHKNQDVTCKILNEITSFVDMENSHEPSAHQELALRCRLELLALMICRAGPAIPVEMYKQLWEHTIGLYALSNTARDWAWVQLLQTLKVAPDNDYCRQLVFSHIAHMDPSMYTNGMFEFVANYNFPMTRQLVVTDQGEKSVLQIPGADVLWSMVLSSPEGTIEDLAARLLASRYVQINEAEGVMLVDVEAAHIVLVEKCMQEMRSACQAIRIRSSDGEDPTNMDITISDATAHEYEGRCRRIILFQKLLLEKIRQKPEFNRNRRADSKVDETDIPYGDSITIRFQCGNDRQVVTMGADHTVEDLYRRLCHASKYTKVNLFAKGKRLNVADRSNEKLSNIDFGGQLLVQRAPDAEVTQPLSGPSTGSSVFESTVGKYFDELFSLMDSDDNLSQMIFDYLSFFPARQTFADSVMAGAARSEGLFPPGKFYQARYAAMALQARLREQIRNKSSLDEKFLGSAIRQLNEALLNPRLISDTISSFQELQLAAVFVAALLEFLRERPSADASAAYFSDGARLGNRLVMILSMALETNEDATVVQDCYGTILEASLHSRIIWEAFVRHPQVSQLHQVLLLKDSRESLREHVARKIDSVCGGDLPSTCPLTKGEIATQFWTVISAIIPDSVRLPAQSHELFDIAERVFRAKDEYERNEALLRLYLAKWSDLLLDHRHQEFVGRDEIDHVVFGLTKLMLCCILSLKSFKRPLNAGDVMEKIFRKYIFTKSFSTAETGLAAVPILESHTRYEMYDLMLALVDDSSTYDALIKLANDVENEGNEPTLATISVDRSMEIRSGTGYVGLYNPRAICYANSLLTQLFMNLNFRKFILGLELQEVSGSQQLLLETQRLFTNMQHSFRRSADPRSFTACVKNSELMPIDISVQMDADEFYNSLFDQWERQLIKDEHKQQFRSFYGGQTLNQIKSKECEHVSERMEPFFAVQCDVQGKSTLQESLQAFVRGDVMEGDNKYKCESCGGKYVDAVKRTCFKEVPDNLIFHLKRFEFDLADFSRRKVYDHFEFPTSIDISAYHIDHLSDPSKPREADMFDLVGVLVHTGTCEHGHYYSYIRERPCPTGTAAPAWVEFDDSNVGPFDPADIAYRAFGGFTEDAFNRTPKQYSAYMLFYQRQTAVENDQRNWVSSPDGKTLKVPMPPALENEVDLKNEVFIREYCRFDPNHTKFLRQLHAMSRTINHGCCSEGHVQETHSLKIVLAHLGNVVWRHMNSEIFCETLLQLRRSVLPCSTCCNIVLKALAADEWNLLNLLLRCTHAKVRSQIRTFLIDCLKVSREKEPVLYGLEGTENDMDLDLSIPTGGIFSSVTTRLRVITTETHMSIRGWDDFYLTLTQMLELGHMETAVLLDGGFLEFCLKLLCMHSYKRFQDDDPDLWRVVSKKSGIYNRLIGFLSNLLLRMDTRLPAISSHIDRLATLDQESMMFPLTHQERNMLYWWDPDLKAIAVLDKALEVFEESKTDHFHPGDIVKSMLGWRDPQAQSSLFKTLIEGVVSLDPPFCDAYVRAALSYCEGCPVADNVNKIIATIAKAVASNSRIEVGRAPGGLAALDFFGGLLRTKNETIFQQKHRYIFFLWVIGRSRVWAPPLLLHKLEDVRQGAQVLFCELYKTCDGWPVDLVQFRWRTLRETIIDMMKRIVYEKDSGMLKHHLSPLIDTCQFLVQQLYDLNQNEDPKLDPYRDAANDTARMQQWAEEVEPRLETWPQDDSLSAADLYDNSGSESDGEEVYDNDV